MKSKLLCPKCSLDKLVRNPETQGWVCMNCGKEVRGSHESSLLIRANGKEIVADYKTMPLQDVLNKWQISNKVLYKLPEIRELRHGFTKYEHRKAEAFAQTENNHNGLLPSFPEFDNNWQPEVQLKWLDLYEVLWTKK